VDGHLVTPGFQLHGAHQRARDSLEAAAAPLAIAVEVDGPGIQVEQDTNAVAWHELA
jgi:hypothetical protein